MDVLSEVLKVIKLEGAIFYNAEYAAPWSFRAPPSRVVVPYFEQRGGHVIFYHLLTEGACIARLEDGQQVAVSAGEVVIFPHGDAHIMSSGPGVDPVDYENLLHRILGQGLTSARLGGGGEVTRFVCGYMSCDSQLSNALLAVLPPILKVPIRDDDVGQWLESCIRLSVGKACAAGAGSEAVLSKLSEVLFVEALRRYILNAPSEQTARLQRVIRRSERRWPYCTGTPPSRGLRLQARIRSSARALSQQLPDRRSPGSKAQPDVAR